MEPTAPPPATEHFVGIDVSKAKLDVSLDGDAPFAVTLDGYLDSERPGAHGLVLGLLQPA